MSCRALSANLSALIVAEARTVRSDPKRQIAVFAAVGHRARRRRLFSSIVHSPTSDHRDRCDMLTARVIDRPVKLQIPAERHSETAGEVPVSPPAPEDDTLGSVRIDVMDA